jgi:hypothetical protein
MATLAAVSTAGGGQASRGTHYGATVDMLIVAVIVLIMVAASTTTGGRGRHYAHKGGHGHY